MIFPTFKKVPSKMSIFEEIPKKNWAMSQLKSSI